MSDNGVKPGALEAYLAHLSGRGCSPHSIRTCRYILGRFERSALAPVAFLGALNDLAPASRCLYGGTVRRYLRWQVEHAYLAADPLAGFRFRPGRPVPKRPFSQEEVERMLASCQSQRDEAIVLVFYDSGVRASELGGLEPEDIDFERATLRIRAGKGNKGRLVGVTASTLDLLRWQVAHPNARDSLFGLHRNCLYRIVRRIGERAGITGAHPHRFRHSFCHRFLAAGGDRGDARVLLGHSSYIMVDRYAAYYEAERALAAQQRLFSVGSLTVA